jgi:hypothetical protein
MNANELIAKAYYLSNVVSRELETVSGSQQADGLDMLNDLLAEKSAKGRLIPYYTHSTFNLVVNQEEYFVPNLIDADVVTYNIGDIRYSMLQTNRKVYFGSPRADNVNSLPTSYHFERSLGGGKIYFYYLPSDVYEVNITGKFALTQVSGCDELSDGLDDFYVAYLKYALAKRISDFYNIDFFGEKSKTLFALEKDVFEVAPPDVQLKKISTFGDRNYINWAYVNLGRGFIP